MGNIEHWLAANREHIWPMKDEDDYTEGDTVICVAINENGNVSVVVVPTDPNRGAVEALHAAATALETAAVDILDRSKHREALIAAKHARDAAGGQ